MLDQFPLMHRLILYVKQHRNPSSPKSAAVLLKVYENEILKPGKYTKSDLIKELKVALASNTVWSSAIAQQHSEEELRSCFTNFLAGLEGV